MGIIGSAYKRRKTKSDDTEDTLVFEIIRGLSRKIRPFRQDPGYLFLRATQADEKPFIPVLF